MEFILGKPIKHNKLSYYDVKIICSGFGFAENWWRKTGKKIMDQCASLSGWKYNEIQHPVFKKRIMVDYFSVLQIQNIAVVSYIYQTYGQKTDYYNGLNKLHHIIGIKGTTAREIYNYFEQVKHRYNDYNGFIDDLIIYGYSPVEEEETLIPVPEQQVEIIPEPQPEVPTSGIAHVLMMDDEEFLRKLHSGEVWNEI